MNAQALKTYKIGMFTITCVALTLYFLDCLWSVSIDLSTHYSVISHYLGSWKFPSEDDLAYPLMALYPAFSYIFAAILGAPFQSALIGMQLASFTALYYLGFFFLLPERLT